MKGLRSTIALALVLGGLGAYIYFYTWKQDDSTSPATGKKTEKLFTVESDKIDEIKVASVSGETTTAKKEGGSWKLVEPVAAAADDGELSGIANALSSAELTRVVDENPTN